MKQEFSNSGKEVCVAKFKDGHTDFKVSLMIENGSDHQVYGRVMCFKSDGGKNASGEKNGPVSIGFKINIDSMVNFRDDLVRILNSDPNAGDYFVVPKRDNEEAVLYGKHLYAQNFVSKTSGIPGVKFFCRQGKDFSLMHCMKKSCAYKLLEELNRMLTMWQKDQVTWSKIVTYNSLDDYESVAASVSPEDAYEQYRNSNVYQAEPEF